VFANGCTAGHDTSYCGSVPIPSRVTVMGTGGAIEVVNDTKLIVRRAVDVNGLSNEERIKRGLLPNEGDEVIEFKPAPGEAHEPSLMPWIATIKASLEAKKQITPSFEDAVQVGDAMDMLRANTIMVGRVVCTSPPGGATPAARRHAAVESNT
jgi:hypothetical protein